jgi:ABC-type sugar transport system substrate-binding protein
MVRVRTLIIGIIILTVGIVIGGSLHEVQKPPPAPTAAAIPQRLYAINVAYSSQPFFQDVLGTGKKIASVAPGVQFTLGGPPDADSTKQIEDLDGLMVRKVNGVILFPADPQSLAPEIDKLAAAGVPVITLFSDVPRSKRLTFVGAPEKDSGMQMALHVLEAHPEFATHPTKILVSFNKPGETVTDARLAGIKQVIGDPRYHNNLKLVQVVNDYGNDARAAEAIGAVLTKTKDIKVIFGLNARAASGALTALREARNSQGNPYQAGDVVVTGWDSDDDVLNGIESGWIEATSVLNSSLCTQIAFAVLDAQTLGYLYPQTLKLRELNFPAVPDAILIPETFVNKANVAGFRHVPKL